MKSDLSNVNNITYDNLTLSSSCNISVHITGHSKLTKSYICMFQLFLNEVFTNVLTGLSLEKQ